MTSKETVTYGQILVIDRLKNTRNGNPRYALTLKTAEGDTLEAVTKSDADFANLDTFFGDLALYRGDWVKVTLTPAGRIRHIDPIDVGALILWWDKNAGGSFPRPKREEF